MKGIGIFVRRMAPDGPKYRVRRAADKPMKRHKNLYCAVTNRSPQRRRASGFAEQGEGADVQRRRAARMPVQALRAGHAEGTDERVRVSKGVLSCVPT
ncbi:MULTISPECIES: hypothetical protein [Burkholderia]|uniref:Uncharacterized protein n=1 Tax=Burkholderia sola TaxID=2843302 RepID=A0ABV2C0T5_9BURK|nr:hypothetical protein [Burkholderia sp. CpTa8-5]MBP0604808.1 hypothetical protein [Burkholderia sp. CpTa8-5]